MQIRGLMMSFSQLNFKSCAKIDGQFDAETNETWETNSSTADTLTKNSVTMATHSLTVPTNLFSIF